MKNTSEAIRQMIYAAEIIVRRTKQKLGEDFDETIIGRGELRKILDNDRDGKGLKSLMSMSAKHFGIRKIQTLDLEYELEVIDENKPIVKIRRVRK